MKLRPWHHVVLPREDLREGRLLDAAEFAVHLDKVCDGGAPVDGVSPAYRRIFELEAALEKGVKSISIWFRWKVDMLGGQHGIERDCLKILDH